MADESGRTSDVEETVQEETVPEETAQAVDEDEQDFIIVAASEDGDPMEFPKETDNTVTFSTIKAQFPKATGLKYRASSGAWRAIRDVDNVLAAPKEGWGNTLYVISVPDEEEKSDSRKRKADDSLEDESEPKQSKDLDDAKLIEDLPVTNLPYAVTEKELREYFEENYGHLEYCQVKTERGSNKSRGFGFIRFKDAETAREALNNSHTLHGRTFYVKVKTDKPMKLFVGRLPHDIEKSEVQEYFEQFGTVEDVFLTKPFKNIGFVTYSNKRDAVKVMRMEHKLKGKTLNIEEGKPAEPRGGNRNNGRGGKGGNYESTSRQGGRFGGGGSGYYDNYSQQQNNFYGGQGGANQLDVTSLLLNYLGGAAGASGHRY